MEPFKTIVYIFSLLLFFYTDATGQHIEWHEPIYAKNGTNIFKISTDNFGNSYVCGILSDTLFIKNDTIPFNRPAGDGFVSKFDPCGDHLWTVTFGGDDVKRDFTTAIHVDSAEMCYVAVRAYGHNFKFEDSVVLAMPGPIPQHLRCMILKIDKAGKLVWSDHSDLLYYEALATDQSGNLYAGGVSAATGNVGGVPIVNPNFPKVKQDLVLAKFDALGNFVWVRRAGGNQTNSTTLLMDIGLSPKGDQIFITGVSRIDLIFAGDTLGYGGYLASYDEFGNEQWITALYNEERITPDAMDVNSYGEIGIVGWRHIGDSDCYTGFYDLSGRVLRESVEDLNSECEAQGFVYGSDKSYFINGTFEDSIAFFDTTLIVPGLHQYISKLDSNDRLQWVSLLSDHSKFPFNGHKADIAYHDSSLYYCQLFRNTLAINNGLDSITIPFPVFNTSGFIAKIQQNYLPGILLCRKDSMEVFGSYETDTGLYVFTTKNRHTCDDSISYYQRIDHVEIDTNVVVAPTYLVAKIPNVSYQWLDCSNGFGIIPNEKNQVFFPADSGEYAVEITKFGCIDTSSCIPFVPPPSVGKAALSHSEKNTIDVYPNPSDGKVQLQLNTNLPNTTIQLLDLKGQLLKIWQFDQLNTTTLQLDVPAGMYVLEVNSGEYRRRKKLVVK
jgi:hypothetical protein